MKKPTLNVRPEGNYFGEPHTDIKFFSTGSKILDLALGGGGWAIPRIANVVGDRSTGKTLIMIEAASNFLRQYEKGKVRYRESEAAFLPSYAAALGMPINKVDFGDNPLDTVEDWYEDLEKVIEAAKGPELYILDSLDALSSRAELKRGLDEGSYGTEKAKMMSKMFRGIVRAMERKQISLLITSQIRDNITTVRFAKKYKRTGGHALDFYASHVLYLAQTGVLKKTRNKVERPIGISIQAKVEKNKIGLPLRQAEFDILFGFGIDDMKSCVNYLKAVSEKNSGPLADYLGDQSLDKWLRYIEEKATPSFYKQELADLHKAVEKHWWATERTFLPKRKKY